MALYEQENAINNNQDLINYNSNNLNNLHQEQLISLPKTRFHELPFEVLLNIIDFFFPFYLHFEKATQEKRNINFNDRRKSIMLLTEVLHRLFSASNILETRITPVYYTENMSLASGLGQTFQYLNTNRQVNVQGLALRQYVLEEVVCELYSLIRVSKRVFYSFLVEDCYDMLVVKLFWEGLHHCIRNPDLVLENAYLDLEDIQPLPGSQYTISEPLYVNVLRARLEPVWLIRLFLSQPSFGFLNYLFWKNNFTDIGQITESDWTLFLEFIREQVTKHHYTLKSSGRKYISMFQVTDFSYIQNSKLDPYVLLKLVYVDLDIPMYSPLALQPIQSITLFKEILEKNENNFSTIEACQNCELFLESIKKLRLDILEFIMEALQEEESHIPSFLGLSPLKILIRTCLYDEKFEEKSEQFRHFLNKLRRHFLPITDIFTAPALTHLILQTIATYKFKSSYNYPTQYCKSVFQVLYQVLVDESEEDQYEKQNLPNFILQAVKIPFTFTVLFDDNLPSHVLSLNKKILTDSNLDIFGEVLENYSGNPHEIISPLSSMFNPLAFRDTLIQNCFSENLNNFIQEHKLEDIALQEILQYLKTLYN